MDPRIRRGANWHGQTPSRSDPVSPVSCIEIPAAILPSSSSALGLVVAEDHDSRSTSRGARDVAPSPAPLRVLLLPPACTVACNTSSDWPQGSTREVLRQKSAARTAYAEPEGLFFGQPTAVRLARQVGLARDLLAIGCRIAGVWVRFDVRGDLLQKSVDRVLQQHLQNPRHSLITSMTAAIARANAPAAPRPSAGERKLDGLRCCFLFLSSPAPGEGLSIAVDAALRVIGYYCSGPSVTSLAVRRLPVALLRSGSPEPFLPATRSVIFSTFLPVQIELSFAPSETFTYHIQTCGQQLFGSLYSRLYETFAAIISPPLLASCVSAKGQPSLVCSRIAWSRVGSKSFRKGTDPPASKEFRGGLAAASNYSEQVRGPSRMPATRWRKSGSLLINDSGLRLHDSTAIPATLRFNSAFHISRSEQSGRHRWATLLSDPSQDLCDGLYAFGNPIYLLEPLLAGHQALRYTVTLDAVPVRPGRDINVCGRASPSRTPIRFRVLPSDQRRRANYGAPLNTLSTTGEAEGGTSVLSRPSSVLLSVKGEFVSAVAAIIDTPVKHLGDLLAADAAAAIARRVAERLAEVCAAYSRPSSQSPERSLVDDQNFKQAQRRSASQRVAPLDVRRFYLIDLALAFPKGAQERYGDAARVVLFSDLSHPGETEDTAADAAAERAEFLLGVPPAAVVPHSFLKDGSAASAVHACSWCSCLEEDCKHNRLLSIAHRRRRLPATVPGMCALAAVFWKGLRRAVKDIGRQMEACGGESDVRRSEDLSRMLFATLVLLAVVLAMYTVFVNNCLDKLTATL